MIPLWLRSSFDLLVHGELHYTLPEEFDRRVALVSFDNAIEASIAWYLSLHPTQRGNRQYPRAAVAQALENYHTKIDFLYQEVTTRSATCGFTKQEIIYIHDQRNLFYHGNPNYIPSAEDLSRARQMAFWIFEFLFEIPDIKVLVEQRIKQIRKLDLYPRDQETDEIIDQETDEIEILSYRYKASEVLYALDPAFYKAFGDDIRLQKKELEQENGAN